MRFSPMIIALVLLSGISLGAQEPPPQFEEKVDVNLVLIDAIVTGSGGDQILGLTRDDFIVREDGEIREIESVDYYTNRRLLTSPEAKAAFDVEQVQEPRYFIFFFDKFPGPSPIEGFDNELWRAIRNAKTFVEEDLMEQDYVAVLGHDARLEIYTDFTRDRERIIEALEQARRFGNGNFEPADGPSIVEHLDESAVRNDSGWVWDGLEMVGEALQSIRGRKVLAMFSPGIFSRRGGVAPLESQYYEPMVQALNAANTTVYGLNLVPGINNNGEMTLTRLVQETGGDYFRNPVSYLTPLQEIENRNNGYYLITYRSEKPEGESGYQKVDVSVKNPEFRIEAREGYLYGER